MRPPQQPVCLGTDNKGELLWGLIPMPRWQQAMFPVKYTGDFMKFWMMQSLFEKTGIEANSDIPSMDLHAPRKTKRQHSGD